MATSCGFESHHRHQKSRDPFRGFCFFRLCSCTRSRSLRNADVGTGSEATKWYSGYSSLSIGITSELWFRYIRICIFIEVFFEYRIPCTFNIGNLLAYEVTSIFAFCQTVENAGYKSCVYFNRNLGYYGYDLTRLTDYEFWFSLPESGFPNFYYAMDMWQYSFTENVPGIGIETDMNLRFVPKI